MSLRKSKPCCVVSDETDTVQGLSGKTPSSYSLPFISPDTHITLTTCKHRVFIAIMHRHTTSTRHTDYHSRSCAQYRPCLATWTTIRYADVAPLWRKVKEGQWCSPRGQALASRRLETNFYGLGLGLGLGLGTCGLGLGLEGPGLGFESCINNFFAITIKLTARLQLLK